MVQVHGEAEGKVTFATPGHTRIVRDCSPNLCLVEAILAKENSPGALVRKTEDRGAAHVEVGGGGGGGGDPEHTWEPLA